MLSSNVEEIVDVIGFAEASMFILRPYLLADTGNHDKALIQAAEVIMLCHTHSEQYLCASNGAVSFQKDNPDDPSDDLDMLWFLERKSTEPR